MITNNNVSRENLQAVIRVCLCSLSPDPWASGSLWAPQCCYSECPCHSKCPSRWNLSCLGKVLEGSPSTPLGSEDVLPIWFHWEGSHLAPGPVATWGIWTFPRAELCSVRIKDSLEGWGSQKNGVEMNKCSLSTYGLPGD